MLVRSRQLQPQLLLFLLSFLYLPGVRVLASTRLARKPPAQQRQRQRQPPPPPPPPPKQLSRERLPLDFGWKHRVGLHGWPVDPYAPPFANHSNSNANNYSINNSPIDPGPSPPESLPGYLPCDWIDVRLPHDGILSNPYGNQPSRRACPDGCSGRSYIPRHNGLWYRKEFYLPDSWRRRALATKPRRTHKLFLEFGGSYRNTTVYVNGERVLSGHECGYTPFRIELHLDPELEHEPSPSTVPRLITVAVFVDPNHGDGGGPSRGSGWWYEGGGLYRNVWLELVPASARIAHNGLVVRTRAIRYGEQDNDNNETDDELQASVSRTLRATPPTQSQTTTRTTTAILELEATVEIELEPLQQHQHQHQQQPLTRCLRFVIEDNVDDDDDGDDNGDDGDDNDNDNEHETRRNRVVTPLRSLPPGSLSDAAETTPTDGVAASASAAAAAAVFTIVMNETVTLREPFLRLWTASQPHLYTVRAELFEHCENYDRTRQNPRQEQRQEPQRVLADSVEVSHGIRMLRFDPDKGVQWNEEPYKIRGFCDHDAFAVVGMAIPDRIHLFRAQASRSIGGNARRTSHNPTDPIHLDIYDRLGTLVIDENRLFANNSRYVRNMGDLVMRDRHHPSVVLWSFCNELGCQDSHEAGGPAFQNVTNTLDGTRPTLANMFTFHDLLSDTIDVQGFSHRHRDVLEKCHSLLPNKPIVQSECCSCNTMRSEDEGCETTDDNPHTECNQKAFNARCLERLVNASDGTDYTSGTYVWTLFDYYGEPPSRPLTVSSTYGQFDLCGFPKSSAFWFRSQWLLSPPPPIRNKIANARKDAAAKGISNGRPFPTEGTVEVHIVESWESPEHWNETRGKTARTIHAYSNAPFIELFVNGVSQGRRSVQPMIDGDGGTYGEWIDVPWREGILAALAQSEDGTELARTSKETNRSPRDGAVLELSLDCPSPLTGTGTALFLDGKDAALVRATIRDASGRNTLHFASHNVTFRIVSGPGTIQGTANGDPKSYQSHTSPSHTAYHGLVRAVVRVTSAAGLSAREKRLLREMEVDDRCPRECPLEGSLAAAAATTATETTKDTRALSWDDDRDIVIEATSPGLSPTRLYIPTSTSRREASVLAVASREAGRPVNFFS